ncbi:MAG: hypothetical protein JSV56_13510 [Methanomassiliicoccales archaeon]|nr:MAG: hypothetical protein JSV56_13510 [Methanomassiliicoccales archaeon]
MPACRICKERIDLSITGVRAHKCKECDRVVCRDHYDYVSDVCYECAGLPVSYGGIAFSFIRKTPKKPKDEPKKG